MHAFQKRQLDVAITYEGYHIVFQKLFSLGFWGTLPEGELLKDGGVTQPDSGALLVTSSYSTGVISPKIHWGRSEIASNCRS
jgi:hypothetical protein